MQPPLPPTGGIRDEKEAFFCIIYACMEADGHLDFEEFLVLARTLAKRSIYQSTNLRELYRHAELALASSSGPLDLITKAAPAVSKPLRPTLFALCTDLILANNRVDAAEQQLLDQLQSVLAIPAEMAATIVEVLTIKNRY